MAAQLTVARVVSVQAAEPSVPRSETLRIPSRRRTGARSALARPWGTFRGPEFSLRMNLRILRSIGVPPRRHTVLLPYYSQYTMRTAPSLAAVRQVEGGLKP